MKVCLTKTTASPCQLCSVRYGMPAVADGVKRDPDSSGLEGPETPKLYTWGEQWRPDGEKLSGCESGLWRKAHVLA